MASAVSLRFGRRTRAAFAVVILSDKKSPIRYLERALSLDEVVQDDDRDFLGLIYIMSAICLERRQLCIEIQIAYPLCERLLVLVESLLRAMMSMGQVGTKSGRGLHVTEILVNLSPTE